jgi:hypothetical protein
MKKVIIVALVLIVAVAAGSLYWYRQHFPTMVAEAVVSDELPAYIPRHIQVKINEFRAPVNVSAEKMIEEMHAENIPFAKVIETIDNATEEQTNAFIEELAETKITSTNQVFDLGKKYFPTDYDVEPFREPFNQNVDLRIIRKGIAYANTNRKTNDVDVETLKEIAKKILVQKEKEYRLKQAGYQ